MARKFITYFDTEGNDYTDELILAVKDKLDLVENIKYILIASASGESALKLAEAIDDDVTNLVLTKFIAHAIYDVCSYIVRVIAPNISLMGAE